jgi:hypothetical protein
MLYVQYFYMFRHYTLSIYTLRFISSDVIRSVFICSDVIRCVIIRSVGESGKVSCYGIKIPRIHSQDQNNAHKSNN